MKRKIISALLVTVLALACVFGLTACKMADKDYTETVNEIAKTYYASHEDYKNFSDITVTMSGTETDQEKGEVDGTIDTTEITVSGSYAVKKAGEVMTFAIDMSMTMNETVNYYDAEDAAKVKTVKTVANVKYEGFALTEGDDTVYVIAATAKSSEDDSTVESDGDEMEMKVYKTYTEEEAYINMVENLLEEINEVAGDFFNTSRTYYLNVNRDSGADVAINKKGEDITYTLNYAGLIPGSALTEINQNLVVEFVANKASKISQDYTEICEGLTETSKVELTIADGANVATSITKDTLLADYTNDYYGMIDSSIFEIDAEIVLVPIYW